MDKTTALCIEVARIGLLEPSEVHEAVGMVINQLDISPTEALARLRTLAGMTSLSTAQIADLVISRSLRLGADDARGGLNCSADASQFRRVAHGPQAAFGPPSEPDGVSDDHQ